MYSLFSVVSRTRHEGEIVIMFIYHWSVLPRTKTYSSHAISLLLHFGDKNENLVTSEAKLLQTI